MQRIAIVHDWLTTVGGAEQVLSAIMQMYPDATLFTGFSWAESEHEFGEHVFKKTYLQHVPRPFRKQQLLIPLLPAAFESLDLKQFDLIISLGTGFSKGVITFPSQRHVSYCHTPARYLWHLGGDARNSGHFDFGLRAHAEHNLRIWDVTSANRVDMFVANSHTTQQRINKIYRQESEVVYPPVNTECFSKIVTERQEYMLSVGRLVAYKRTDLAIEACLVAGKKLIIAGEGPEQARLVALANASPLITFVGRPNNHSLAQLYSEAAAVIFAGEEDFGIVPVEAQSAGTPVIAFAKGGARETVLDSVTGTFFHQQTVDSLCEVLKSFKSNDYDHTRCRQHAERFNVRAFSTHFAKVVAQ